MDTVEDRAIMASTKSYCGDETLLPASYLAALNIIIARVAKSANSLVVSSRQSAKSFLSLLHASFSAWFEVTKTQFRRVL